MFENNFNITLIQTFKMYMFKGLNYKAAEIIRKWKGLNGGNKRNKYLQTLENSYFEIEIHLEDLENNNFDINSLRETRNKLQ